MTGGAEVAGVVALTGKQYSAKIAPNPELLSLVHERYKSVEEHFRTAVGYGFDALTESEARYLAKHDNAQRVRDRIIEAGNTASRTANTRAYSNPLRSTGEAAFSADHCQPWASRGRVISKKPCAQLCVIRSAGGSQYAPVCGAIHSKKTDRPNRTLVVQLEAGADGDFDDAKTALVSRTDFMNGKELLWERAQSNRFEVQTPSAISGQSNNASVPSSNVAARPVCGVAGGSRRSHASSRACICIALRSKKIS